MSTQVQQSISEETQVSTLNAPAWKKGMLGNKGTQSPTDQNLSPCTQKLAAAKGRHFTKGKPISLFGTNKGSSTLKSGLGKELSRESENEESKESEKEVL